MIGVIDYGLGNLASVGNALKKLEIPYVVSGDKEVLKGVKALVFPGVGAAGRGMENLKEKGLDKFIEDAAEKGVPILGICLGMQLMFDESEEGGVKCLGLIEGKVRRFRTKLKVPEIGWNEVKFQISNFKFPISNINKKNLINNISENSYFYFVNSYYCEPEDEGIIAGVTDYDGEFCSVVIKDNLVGVQFHPEKSGEKGLQLLKNYFDIVLKRSVAG